jgi:hypothetical protein
MSLRDLVVAAPTIVVGTVESASSRWNTDHSLIVTDVRVRVSDVLKGTAIGQVTITQPGGQVGKLRVDVDGAVAFHPGDEAVWFLAPGQGGETGIVGLFRGRFDVAVDPRGQKLVHGVTPEDLRSLRSLAPASRGELTTAPMPGGAVEFQDFLGGLRSLVEDVQVRGGK